MLLLWVMERYVDTGGEGCAWGSEWGVGKGTLSVTLLNCSVKLGESAWVM